MSADEVVSWKAYLRRRPRGFHWDNWAQASIVRMIDSTKPRQRNDKLPKFDDYLFKAPKPLYIARLEREGRARQAGVKRRE